MGRVITRLVALLFGALIGAAICGAVAALFARRTLTSSGEPDSDEIALVSIFEPLEFTSSAQSFRGGSLLCWYGGGTLDLRGAQLDPAGARLQVRAIFGGAQILVPETWRVTSEVIGIFGGVGDGRPKVERPDDAPELILEGLAIMGGVGITSDGATAGPVSAPAD